MEKTVLFFNQNAEWKSIWKADRLGLLLLEETWNA
jgi:hypothetical protein